MHVHTQLGHSDVHTQLGNSVMRFSTVWIYICSFFIQMLCSTCGCWRWGQQRQGHSSVAKSALPTDSPRVPICLHVGLGKTHPNLESRCWSLLPISSETDQSSHVVNIFLLVEICVILWVIILCICEHMHMSMYADLCRGKKTRFCLLSVFQKLSSVPWAGWDCGILSLLSKLPVLHNGWKTTTKCQPDHMQNSLGWFHGGL